MNDPTFHESDRLAPEGEKKVVLVGELSLCNLYKMAFEIAGFKVNLEKNNLVTKGLFHVAKSASLI